MKKLLFVIPAFNHGGTNKSLLNMINSLDLNKYSVTIFALLHYGPYKEKFKEYDLMKEKIFITSLFSHRNRKIRNFIKYMLIYLIKIIYLLFFNDAKNYVYDRYAKKLSVLNYDTVIAMEEGEATNFVSKIKNNNKIAWVRCDYRNYIKLINKNEKIIYGKFNKIICVSNFTKEVFVNYYNEFHNKTYPIHNVIDWQTIIELSKNNDDIDDRFTVSNDETIIISIGRFDKVKQFDLIPFVVHELKEKNIKFKWYLIGDGKEKEKIIEEQKKFNVEKEFILLGEKNNPYPYIKSSDILICTSFSEACPNVINEAKILHIPVITTDFPSAIEFIETDYNGIISTIDSLPVNVEKMMKNYDYYKKIKINISNFTYNNKILLEKLENIL